MAISFQSVTELLRYSQKEESELLKCIQTHSQRGMGSTAKCCALFRDKIFSCCNQSGWDRALKTMRKHLSHNPNCSEAHVQKISEFLLRYLISKEAAPAENVPLLTNIMRKPVNDMDALVAQAGEIDFFDLFHRIPYSEDALSYPDRETLFNLFCEEHRKLQNSIQTFSTALNTNPVVCTARGIAATMEKMLDDSVKVGVYEKKPESEGTLVDQFDAGVAQAKRGLENCRPLLQEANFRRQEIQRTYIYLKGLVATRSSIEDLHNVMEATTSTRRRIF